MDEPETRVCVGCGREFIVPNQYSPKIRHVKGCGRKPATRTRSAVTDQHFLVFTAIDGEGVTDPATGRHDYVMLSVGTETYTRPDGERFTWPEIFDILWSHYERDPLNVFVGFYLGYDFTQWFRTLPENVARKLLTSDGIRSRRRKTKDGIGLPPSPVRIGHWEVDTLAARRVKLRRAGSKEWMYVNDAGPFFQTSFLKAIDPAKWPKPIVTPKEYAIIKRGKEERSTAVADADMKLYNRTENIALERLMNELNRGLTAAGIRLDRDAWYGPGQAAQAWLNNIHAPSRAEIEENTPREVLEAAQATYYGGWFEIFAHGHVSSVSYEYDINSAYPSIISQLPDFRCGEWRRTDTGILSECTLSMPTLVSVSVFGSSLTCGALPYRDGDGKILRPRTVKGWYWASEVQAALRAGLIDTVDVHDAWTFIPYMSHRPFAAIADMYQRRLAVGKNTPEGIVYKLIYNSAYGKMAQSVGSPKYASALHASLITSGTRTMILDAIATHPRGTDALLMVATDGVYFTSPHPTLDIDSQRLGAWDVTERHNLTLLMPGVYWDDETRERVKANTGIKLKSRGVSADALATQLDTCDQAWTDCRIGDPWPTIDIPLRFDMITAKQALNRNDWESAGTVRTPEHPGDTPLVKSLSADPSAKRTFPYFYRDGRLQSTSYGQGPTLETTPYSERFGRELADIRDDRGIDVEGHAAEEAMRDIMRG